jgi:outer membrane immunogenic protein
VGFGPGWSVGFEYDHIFLGGHDLTFVNTATNLPLASTYHTSGDVDLATIRLNYRFGGFGVPVAARY